ncbi:E3 ubiquitin-protein ligase DZIP3-like [Branchiostoma lanceolatum]|uniref:E3 ubiquitin-protein ligase DZIP3-like n=1 Tax=Branchiostoma lanceolatum TaxID=7740 RepID=UPI003451893D
MATEVYTEETANGAKVAALLIDVGTPLVRAVFDEEVRRMSPPSLQLQLRKSKNRLGRLNPDQQDILYNSPTGVANSSEDFDIVLLSLLLGRLCHMKPPKTGWSKEPPAEDNSPVAWIIRLRLFRNKNYGHMTSTALSQEKFDQLWEELSDILIELGGDPDRIVKRKAQNIDLDRAKMYMERFDKLLIAQSEDLIAIKENVEVQTTEMKEQTTEIKKQSEKLDNLEEGQKAILAEIKQQSPCKRIRVEVHATQVPNSENQPAMSQPEVPPQPYRPFVLQLKSKRVKKCQGCRQPFKDHLPPADVVIQHEDNYPGLEKPLPRVPLPRVPLPRVPLPRVPLPRVPLPRVPLLRVQTLTRYTSIDVSTVEGPSNPKEA